MDLDSRVQRGPYCAQPSRRVYIPKPGGRQRPLGLAALEDKIVQQAAVTVLNCIDEERFLEELRGRLAKFGLELHPAKTRLIEFGRWVTAKRRSRGEGKPETFDFLGFTHLRVINRKSGRYVVRRKTVRKRMRAKLA